MGEEENIYNIILLILLILLISITFRCSTKFFMLRRRFYALWRSCTSFPAFSMLCSTRIYYELCTGRYAMAWHGMLLIVYLIIKWVSTMHALYYSARHFLDNSQQKFFNKVEAYHTTVPSLRLNEWISIMMNRIISVYCSCWQSVWHTWSTRFKMHTYWLADGTHRYAL